MNAFYEAAYVTMWLAAALVFADLARQSKKAGE